jgi:glutaminyl-peptide cyclotransferase
MKNFRSWSRIIPTGAITTVAVLLFFSACSPTGTAEDKKNTGKMSAAVVPVFNADSAFRYIHDQLDFGYRIPGTAAQTKCAKWMQQKLNSCCDTVYEQNVIVKAGNGRKLPCINLIGAINPNAAYRILLLTHWDSRPWAEMDTKDVDSPIVAADDAASGVAVLLELARLMKSSPLPKSVGVDILLEDVEDYGRPEWSDNSYCLGTQYWATHPHVKGYKAAYGVLLDMVGARNAQFPLESISAKFAPDIQQKVWKAAGDAGYSSYFVYNAAAEITDDHLMINEMTGIKTIDIINLTQDPKIPFAPYWHTHADNIEIIDKNTLKAVGQTLAFLLYNEEGK